jgi:dUTP pyrophosphatase
VLLVNTDPEAGYTISQGDRIAQLVIQQVARCTLVVVDELPPSTRGAGGFGHTGHR